ERRVPGWLGDGLTEKYDNPASSEAESKPVWKAMPKGRGGLRNWVGGLVICVVVCSYTFLGGMRGANWAQTFQAMLLLVFGLVGFIAITRHPGIGGFESALSNVSKVRPGLRPRG